MAQDIGAELLYTCTGDDVTYACHVTSANATNKLLTITKTERGLADGLIVFESDDSDIACLGVIPWP